MKIKCPTCDKFYRTYDAILTHYGQTNCLNKKNITKKLLNSIDNTLKERIIRHKLKKIESDMFSLNYYMRYQNVDYEKQKSYYDNKMSNANNNLRILKGFILDILEKENEE